MAEKLQLIIDNRGDNKVLRDLILPKLISGQIDVSELDIETGG
jgi:hypothetical protein